MIVTVSCWLASHITGKKLPVSLGGLQETKGAVDVAFNKFHRTKDTSVHVRFGREVYNHVRGR
jgi:hypothetical protein